MRLILGIGNPGSRYNNTRHNIGFMFLDHFAEKYSLSFLPSKNEFYFAGSKLEGEEFLLIRPVTYVNNSGLAASQAIEDFNISVSDLLVICDDVNLPFGTYRVRASGGDGGHNGLASIIYHLTSNNFPRIRLGIGNDFEKGDMADYVLSRFNSNDIKTLNFVFSNCSLLAEDFIKGGLKSMLDTNSKLPGLSGEANF